MVAAVSILGRVWFELVCDGLVTRFRYGGKPRPARNRESHRRKVQSARLVPCPPRTTAPPLQPENHRQHHRSDQTTKGRPSFVLRVCCGGLNACQVLGCPQSCGELLPGELSNSETFPINASRRHPLPPRARSAQSLVMHPFFVCSSFFDRALVSRVAIHAHGSSWQMDHADLLLPSFHGSDQEPGSAFVACLAWWGHGACSISRISVDRRSMPHSLPSRGS